MRGDHRSFSKSMIERELRKDQKEGVPFEHYEAEFRKTVPEEAASRCGVSYADGVFELTFLYERYRVTWPDFSITSDDPEAIGLTNLPCQTQILRFLTRGKKAAASAEWKSFRELPWGEVYITQFTGRCITRAAYSFGTRTDAFRKACEKMNAVPGTHGDCSYIFDLIGNYQIQLIIYEGDDEFPPSSQILFSGNFSEGFEPEDRVVACDILITTLKKMMAGL